MEQSAVPSGGPSVLTEIPRYSAPGAPTRPIASSTSIPAINLVLFGLTLITTTIAGADWAGVDVSILRPIEGIRGLAAGLAFSIPLMAILLAHEMGHYLTARRYRVDTSLPYFIPAPFPSLFLIGTFGAFIRMRARPNSRREMFDIGAAGPWAGMLIAVPCLIVGLKLSQVVTQQSGLGGLEFGNSILFYGLARWALHVDPNTAMVQMHPTAVAGWVGLFVTTLNLLPVGQLDGGHVIYALFPRHHRRISTLFVLSCVLMVIVPLALGLDFWGGWLVWGVLAVALGLGHPSTLDQDRPLGRTRRVAAWATIALFVLTFSPVPLSFTPPNPYQQQPQSVKVEHHPAVPLNHHLPTRLHI